MVYPQAGEGTNPVMGCCDLGEQICFGPTFFCTADNSLNHVGTWTYAVRPVPLDGDLLLNVGEYQALVIVAPAPALALGASLGTPPWDRLFANPATLWCSFARPMPNWKTCGGGRPEWVDFFYWSAPLRWDLVGTSWVIQWARCVNGVVTFSNGMDVTISV